MAKKEQKVEEIKDIKTAEEVVKEVKPKKGETDSLIESLKAELGVVEEKKSAESGKRKAESGKTQEKREEKAESVKGKAESEKEEKVVRKYRSKKYIDAAEKVEKSKEYALNEAIELAKQVSYTKFPATIELHINTTVKNLRGFTTLPFAAGKKLRVLAFGKGAQESGADLVGDDKKIDEIKKGKIDFDVMVADASWMPKIVPLAKVLGPRGLMPNPKNGTITDDLKKAVLELQGGKTEYKTEKDRKVLHMSVGKVLQESSEIAANIKQLYMVIGKTKIAKMVLSPTMGPGVKVSLSSI